MTAEFASERHVEVSLRFLKSVRDEPYAIPAGYSTPSFLFHLTCSWTGTALMQAAVTQFPDSALVQLYYASFIIAYCPKEKERAQV